MGTAQVGGPRGNIDIEYIWLCEDCWAEGDETFLFGSVSTQAARCSRCGCLDPSYCADKAANDPRPARGGWAMEFSTSTELVTWPMYVWDVNGYYHELGVHHGASKGEIKEAYERLNGQASPRLTFVVKQLLDPDIRRRYDASELGSVFVDEYIVRWISQQMADDAREARLAGLTDEEFEPMDFSHLINKPFETVVDRAERAGQGGGRQSPTGGWGFYRWRTGSNNFEQVGEWRGTLCRVATERGERFNLSVGLAGGMASPIEVIPVGYRIVVFLDVDEQPTEHLAHEALNRVATIIQVGETINE